MLQLDGKHVKLELRVARGVPVTVRRVDIPGVAKLPARVTKEVLRARSLKIGDVFDEARFDEMKAAILEAQQDRGFPFAKVDAKAHIDLLEHRADVTMTLEPGSEASYGAVSIEGLKSIPEGTVRDTLKIREGAPYSRSDLTSAQRALLSLGVFGTVEIREDLTHPETKRVPIAVVVRETELRTVRLGGGADFNVLRLNLHLAMGWEHRNFLGGTRHLAVNVTPGIDLWPTRLGGKFETNTRAGRKFASAQIQAAVVHRESHRRHGRRQLQHHARALSVASRIRIRTRSASSVTTPSRPPSVSNASSSCPHRRRGPPWRRLPRRTTGKPTSHSPTNWTFPPA